MDLVGLAVNAALVIIVILVLGRRPAKRFARRAWSGSEGDRGLARRAAGAASSLSNARRVPVTLETPRCLNCGRDVRDSSLFCRACGTPLQPAPVQADTQALLAEGAAAVLAEPVPVPLTAGRLRCIRCGSVGRWSDTCRACGAPRQRDLIRSHSEGRLAEGVGSILPIADPIRSDSETPFAASVASILSIADRVPPAPGRPRCLHCGRYVRTSSDVCQACGTPRQPDPPLHI